ncbi:MAG TPA: tetratricopeptide repeat protein [Chthonomonadaceae bacterium]|nr:tetratricopeptide repeat protein [Chthonomonadaceae bacterium]
MEILVIGRLKSVCSLLILLAPAALPAAGQQAHEERYPPGIVVTSVAKGSAADKAGLRPGDLLLTLDGAPVRFTSTVQPVWDRARWARKPRVVLTARRESQTLTLTAPSAETLGVTARPPLSSNAQELFRQAIGQPTDADVATKLRAAAKAAALDGDFRASAWLWLQVYLQQPAGSRDEAEIEGAVLKAAEAADDSLLEAAILKTEGIDADRRGRSTEAEALHRRALAILERDAPDSLDLAGALGNAGSAEWTQGRLADAEAHDLRAMAIFERLEPNSRDLAACLQNLGNVAADLDRLEEAETDYRRAAAILEQAAPNSLDFAKSLGNAAGAEWARGRLDEAERDFKKALDLEERLAPYSLDLAGTLNNLGLAARARGRMDEAAGYYARALNIRERIAPDSLYVANSLLSLGDLAGDRGRLSDAADAFARSLAIYERLAPDSLALAAALTNAGSVAREFGKLEEAEDYYKRAYAIRERLAPDSTRFADSLISLGSIAAARGRLDSAAELFGRALSLYERIAPNTLGAATVLDDMGNAACDYGRVDEAEGYFKRAYAIRKRLAPGSLDCAGSDINLGRIAIERGMLDEAESLYADALSIQQRLAPQSLEIAKTYDNLGAAACDRGKFDEAEACHRLGLAIRERIAPNSPALSASFANLGVVAYQRGNLDKAAAFYKRDIEIVERFSPGSLADAISLNNMGTIARAAGHLDEAETYYRKALSIRERIAPDSLAFAGCLGNLGNVALARNRLDEAESLHARALDIAERIAPDSLDVAQSLYNLGLIAAARPNPGEAERRLQRAWQIVRKQGKTVAGDFGRQEFGSAKALYAADLVGVQLALGKLEPAFVTLEQGRAQALAQSIAGRGITERVTPAALWKPYQAAVSAHDAAFKSVELALSTLERATADRDDQGKGGAAGEAAEARQRFEAAKLEEARTREEMDTRWAAVRRANEALLPPAIDPIQARKQLAPGTLFLEFLVGEGGVALFAATRDGADGSLLAAKPADLQRELALIRQALAGGAKARGAKFVGPGGTATAADLRAALRDQYQKLFPPRVRSEIEKAKRLIISPDGFLWDLPFAALITNPAGPPDYLGLRKPISYAQSLTVLSTTGPARGAAGKGALVIGDPVYDAKHRGDRKVGTEAAAALATEAATPDSGAERPAALRAGELRMMTRDGSAPSQLPFAEAEARSVAALYHTVAHTGAEPTESWFRLHAPDARVLHLASHGFLNPYAPQFSGVLLAVPETPPPAGQYDNDGTLQAWEIWNLRLKADLVVLSACETGRGRNETAEGLVGLTRSLQYAGAKSIVASQWKVADASTAALMTAFHSNLIAGKERDEALRLAMAEIAKREDLGWSAPYYWAPFVLVGETGKMPKP